MDRPDDELDNLFRAHLSGQLDPVRGQARRAFEREVTAPMRLRLRREARRRILARVAVHGRRYAPMALAMAACMAVGFYLPRLTATSSPHVETAEVTPPVPSKSTPASVFGSSHLGDYEQTVFERHDDRGPEFFPDGTPGHVIRHSRVEATHYVDPQTRARTEYLFFPPEQDTVYSAARQ